MYFDESGTFSLKVNAPSVVCGVIVPETFHDGLTYYMSRFEHRVQETQSVSKEVKGSQLTFENRDRVCRFVGRHHRQLTVVAALIDPVLNSPQALDDFRRRQTAAFMANKERYVSEGGASAAVLQHYDRIIGRMANNSRLDDQALAQTVAVLHILPVLLQLSISRYVHDRYRKCFHEYRFIFDAKLRSKLAEMEKYLSSNVMPFLSGRARANHLKMMLPNTWTASHPFRQRFMAHPGAMLLNSVFSRRLEFLDSAYEPGLRMADIIANTLYRHYKDPADVDIATCFKNLRPALKTGTGHPVISVKLGD